MRQDERPRERPVFAGDFMRARNLFEPGGARSEYRHAAAVGDRDRPRTPGFASLVALVQIGMDGPEAIIGNQAPIGGVKVVAENGWFAARPSGTEDIYKIYGESFRDAAHLERILAEAQQIVDAALRDGGGA